MGPSAALCTDVCQTSHVLPLFSAWLGPEHDDSGIVQRIDKRIEAVTGLDMSTAEQLQVRFNAVDTLVYYNETV